MNTMKRSALTLLILSLVTLINACSSAPQRMSTAVDHPDPGTAVELNLYHDNAKFIGAFVNLKAYIDGVEVGTFNSRESLTLKVAPGKRMFQLQAFTLGMADGPTQNFELQLEAGQRYFMFYSSSVSSFVVIGTAVSASHDLHLRVATEQEWLNRKQ